MLNSLAALTATLIFSAALSYILPVIAAGQEKRIIAKSIHGFGGSSEEMISTIGIRAGAGSRAVFGICCKSVAGVHA